MSIKRTVIVELIAAALILLWIYTAFSKLVHYSEFKQQLLSQPFSKGFSQVLAISLPGTELIIALLLCFNKTRFTGISLSAVLMVLFTGYVGLALWGYFAQVPCSCGGVLQDLGWEAHFYFNLFWTFLAFAGLWFNLNLKGRRRIF